MGLPLPGEIVLLTAGALAARGEFSILLVTLSAWLGTIAGGTGGYWVGRIGGAAVLKRRVRWLGITGARERAAQEFFDRNGARTIVVARFIAILRVIAGIVAGSVGMPFGLFSLCNAIGGLIWAATFAAIGYFFGSHLPLLENYTRRLGLGLLIAVIVVSGAAWLYRAHRARSGSSAQL